VVTVTKFDEGHCHKWALLLNQRQEKLNKLLANIAREEYSSAKRLFQEIFYGAFGKQTDPGMIGSLLYHMAMVTKMETESRVLLEELKVAAPDIDEKLWRFFGDFASDATELTKNLVPLNINPKEVAAKANLTTDEKISLFNKLNEKTRSISNMLDRKDPKAVSALEELFQEWQTIL
jgi:hypothetical protein